jgi:KEOPS complex subunit Cgi121
VTSGDPDRPAFRGQILWRWRPVRIVDGRAAVPDVDAFLADLDEVAATHGATVQAFDARYVVSRAHLARAVTLADRAIDRGEAVARDRGVEILLYAAGRRQIDRALTMGVAEGPDSPVVVLIQGGDEDAAAEAVESLTSLTPAETLGAFEADRVRSFFGIDDRELAAADGTLADLVLERVALLDVEK